MSAVDPNKVAIYMRWSTEDQGQGHTLAIQTESCRHYCLSQGWRVREELTYIDDGFTGGNLDRPALARLRADIRMNRVSAVVVYKVDRLSRNILDMISLVLGEWDGRCALRSATEPIDTTSEHGRMFFTFLSSFADFERGTIRTRTLSGKQKNAEAGKNAGMPYPFGYERGTETGTYRIVEEEAAIVRLIFQLYLNGMGCRPLAEHLNAVGLLNRTEGPGRPRVSPGKWSNTAVLRVLSNRTYIGELVYNQKKRNPRAGKDGEPYYTRRDPESVICVPSAHIPPIIDRETFVQVEQLRASKRSPNLAKRAISSPHLLTGVLWCTCGHSMVGRKANHKSGRYYWCSGRKNKGRGVCQSAMIRAEVLDDLVLGRLEEVYGQSATPGNLAWLEELEGRRENLQLFLQRAERELQKSKTALQDLMQEYREQKVRGEAYQSLYEMLTDSVRKNEETLGELLRQQEELSEADTSFQERAEAFQALRVGLKDLPDSQVKMLLRLLVHQIRAFRGEGSKQIKLHIEYTGGPHNVMQL